jgi:hypothetical protein
MTIKFPKVHIATSVVNRILNVADGLPDVPRAPASAPLSSMPDTATQSAILDEKLATSQPGALPGIDQAPDPGGTLTGRPLLETLVDPEGQ